MASTSRAGNIWTAHSNKSQILVEEEEGLLTGVASTNVKNDTQIDSNAWSRRKIVGTAAFFIILLISGAFVRTLVWAPVTPGSTHTLSGWYQGDNLLSNGTHEFKRTVIIVSIDGLRADYLDRGLTPHLLSISENGLRAKSMKPVFPNFWDPQSQTSFHYNRIESAWVPEWWYGEPMWETAGKAGVITANLMWPGPPKTRTGASPTYFVPWKDHVPLPEKLDQILKWIDLPVELRPQLLMAYEPSLDQAGHATGPMSARVNRTLSEVDSFAKDLQLALHSRNLTDVVDIVFVSDHGMTDTSHPEHVYMDDIIGEQGLVDIEHEDGWPSMGIRFKPSANSTHYLELLLSAADKNPEKFGVYTHDTMPERYHFSQSERIAPIYVVPKIGYVLTTKEEGDIGMSKGNHGYDNNELSMHAMFIAHGPFSTDVKSLHQSGTKPKTGDHWHSTTSNTYIMERFPNVEIYNLVIKLLGIDEYAAPNNGSVGFWDKYL
ncbi:hypothetical protein H0H93_004684 [Arthromyces matolae]|nr:hypothetical protein H0H93_004684 [Arthromyces matolae]